MITICKHCRKVVADDGGTDGMVMVGELCPECQVKNEFEELMKTARTDLGKQREEYVKSKVRKIWLRFPLKYLTKFFLVMQLSPIHLTVTPPTIGSNGTNVEMLLGESIKIICKYRRFEWLFFRRMK